MGQVTQLWLSSYLVLQPGNKTARVSWPDPYTLPYKDEDPHEGILKKETLCEGILNFQWVKEHHIRIKWSALQPKKHNKKTANLSQITTKKEHYTNDKHKLWNQYKDESLIESQ